MKYGFHPEAEEEFLDAIDYYEGCEPGLGYDFAIEVHSTIRISSVFQTLGLFSKTTYVGAKSGVFHMALSIPKMEMSSSFLP